MATISTIQILKGREFVNAYRTTHAQLYVNATSLVAKALIPDMHTPLLEKMLVDLKSQGFNSLEEFFTESEKLNIQELGLTGKVLTKADIETLEGKWQ